MSSFSWREYKLKHIPSCEGCTLLDQPGPCMGAGDRQTASIIYIAQNPGVEEVKARPMQPLVGASGNVFNRQLFEAGIRRSDLYITNQVKCLTPGNRTPTDLEVAKCRPIIQRELEQCRADTVVLAGSVAFKANIGSYSTLSPGYHPSDNVMVRMGCVEQKDGRKWIGTIHPAFVMRMPDWKQAATDHLRKAAEIAGRTIPLPRVITYPTQEDIGRHREAAIRNRAFADDVETEQDWGKLDEDDYIGGDYRVTMCGYSAIPYEAIILTPDQIEPEWGSVYQLPDVTQFEHNGEYDRYHLEKICPQLNQRFDTMCGAHILRSYAPKKLKPHTLSQYTYLPYYNRDLDKVNARLYCGMDNITTLLAGLEQRKQIRKWELERPFERRMRLMARLEQWRRKGVNVDIRRAFAQRRFIETRIQQARDLISKICGPLFNPGSPQQVGKLLYEIWKLPEQFNKERGPGGSVILKRTVDNEARKRLRKYLIDHYGFISEEAGPQMDPLAPAQMRLAYNFLVLQDYLEGEEVKLTFLDRISPDMRIHAYFKGHGTTSFRLSSKPNLQNWPIYDVTDWGGARSDNRDKPDPTGLAKVKGLGSLRSIVIADDPEEDLLVTSDFEQIELWAYAFWTECKWLLDVYYKGEYIYGKVYEDFWAPQKFFQEGKPRKKKFKLDSVSEKFLRRAKAIPLGFLYGRSAAAVAEEHGWPVQEAEAYRAKWFKLCPELLKSYDADRFQMEQHGYIRYPWGHVIWFPTRKPSDVYAMRGQHPAACVLENSILQIEDAIESRGWVNTRPILSVHDSLTFNIGGGKKHPERVVDFVENVLIPIQTQPYPEFKGHHFRCSIEVSERWDWDAEDYNEWKDRVFPSASNVTIAG
jgi:uracil-DNA glycosylase family 4